MKLWLPGIPGVHVPPDKIADAAREALGPVPGGLPVTTGPVAPRVRLIFPFPGDGEQPTPEQRHTFERARVTTLAWYYCAALEGLLWEEPGMIVTLYAAKEYGRAAGVEVVA